MKERLTGERLQLAMLLDDVACLRDRIGDLESARRHARRTFKRVAILVGAAALVALSVADVWVRWPR